MRLSLELAENLVDDKSIAGVAELVSGVVDGWHDWVAPDPDSKFMDRYFDQNPTHRELLAKSYQASLAYGSPGANLRIRVAGTNGGEGDCCNRLMDGSIDLETAVPIAKEPLQVVVENERRDGKIIMTILSGLSEVLAERLQLTRPPVRFSHGGGKAELIKLVDFRLSSLNVQPRMIVIVDSDAKYPGHLDGDSNRVLLLQEAGVAVHLLQKRALENYVISDRILRAYVNEFPDVRPAIDVISELDSDQRDHYPVKTGLSRETLWTQPEPTQAMFVGATLPVTAQGLPRLIEKVCDDDGLVPGVEDLQERRAIDEFERIIAKMLELI